jgi:uncharacterized protein
MDILRNAARLILILVLVIGVCSGSAFAETAKDKAAPAECRGADMLAELATADPESHKRILDKSAVLENSEALLWKIEKAGTAPSHLFGTIHLSDIRVTTIPPKVIDALSSSKTLALEVADLSDAALGAAMATSAELLVYADGQTLEQKLQKAEFERVQAVVKKAGIPGDVAKLLKPWLVSTLLAISDCERRQIDAGAPVVDMRIAEHAKEKGIPVVGLETIELQLAALASVPDQEQLQMLKVGLKYTDRTSDMLETLLQLYLKRQMGAAMPFQIALAEKAGVPASAFDGFQKALLVDRNATMTKKAAPLLDKGQAFIAVGALHLPGKSGLVALLREAGYTVTPAE